MSKKLFGLRIVTWVQNVMFYILKLFLKPFIVLRYNVHYHIPKEVRKVLKKKALLLPYHTFSWDPLMIAGCFTRGLHWVATEAIFRKKLLKFLMTYVFAAIPKTKNRSDMEMLKFIQGYLALNRVVGIFPEGQQTWDGKGLPPVAGTDKLIRFLKVPVVFVRTEGAFLTKPRWTWNTFRNRIDIYYEIGIGAEEIQDMKLSEISSRLDKFLDYNEYEMQKQRQIPLKSKKRAESLELSLFTCPLCKSLSTMRSKGNLFSCCSCKYQVEVGPYGLFENRGQKPFYPSPVEWNKWQQENLLTYFENSEEGKPLVEDEGIILFTSKRRRPLVRWGKGRAVLYHDRIEFFPEKKEKRIFDLQQVTGFNVFKQQSAEFYFEHTLYRMQFTQVHSSAYKWMSLYEYINHLK